MAKVTVIDRNRKRGASTARVLRANGYESRVMNPSDPKSNKINLKWPDIVLLADQPAPRSFKVVYRGSDGRPSKDDTYFFLELARYLIRESAVGFPFPLN